MAEPTEDVKKGPRKSCPACGSAQVTPAVYCYPERRVFLGVGRLFKMLDPDEKGSAWCGKEGRHLHQKCTVCGCAWIGTPVEIKSA